MFLEQPHRFRIDRLAAHADRRGRAEEIQETLTSAAAAAGLDQRGRFVPAAVAIDPEMGQTYFLFGFFFADVAAFGRAFAFAAGFFAGRSGFAGAAARGGWWFRRCTSMNRV